MLKNILHNIEYGYPKEVTMKTFSGLNTTDEHGNLIGAPTTSSRNTNATIEVTSNHFNQLVTSDSGGSRMVEKPL